MVDPRPRQNAGKQQDKEGHPAPRGGDNCQAKKDGKELDKEFMDEQIDLHQETIGVLKDLDEKTKDANLKRAITKTLPKMEAHLERAKAVRKKLS